jgi:hypothetical protein
MQHAQSLRHQRVPNAAAPAAPASRLHYKQLTGRGSLFSADIRLHNAAWERWDGVNLKTILVKFPATSHLRFCRGERPPRIALRACTIKTRAPASLTLPTKSLTNEYSSLYPKPKRCLTVTGMPHESTIARTQVATCEGSAMSTAPKLPF